MESVKDKVVDIFTEVLALDEPPNVDDRIRDDLDASSMDIVTLLVELEETFSGTIEEEELTQFVTVNDVIKYIESRLGRSSVDA